MRIHFHTACYWFSGSETTLLHLLDAAFRREDTDPLFTYRAWPEYELGLRRRLAPHVQAEAIRLPDPADLKAVLTRRLPRRLGRAVRGGLTLLPIKRICLAWDVGRMARRS